MLQQVLSRRFRKLKSQFAAEARSLDLTSLNDMPERKRLTLAGALILKQVARALDDVADMFIRQVKKMHHKAEEALIEYQMAHADRTDALIAKLREITLAYKAEGSREERLALIETLRWHSECDSNALHAARERFGSGSRPSNRSQLRRKGTDPLAGSTPRCGSHVHHPVRPRATDESQI